MFMKIKATQPMYSNLCSNQYDYKTDFVAHNSESLVGNLSSQIPFSTDGLPFTCTWKRREREKADLGVANRFLGFA